MLVTSSRTTMMGPLASPVATSPGSHHLSHHHTSHSDDDDHHHPADLSPRSSSSSLVSSNESLLNTPISVPSPPHQRQQRRSSDGQRIDGDDDNDSGHDDHVSGSSPASSPALKERGSHSTSGSAASDEDINALQNLRNAFERSQYPSYFHHHRESSTSPQSNNKSESDQMEQHINKAFTILGSPVAPHHQHHHLLNSPTNLSKSGDEMMTTMMSDDEGHAYAMALIGSVSPKNNLPRQQASVQQAAIFQCPLCAVVCNSRHDFNEHIVTHSTQHRACPNCSFIATNADELRDHLQDIHGGDDMGLLSDDEEVKTPKTNAQGKLKTFKCKQCDYVAVTKKEFWDHNKTMHIRQEKMLHCPKCDFVTEYKHHLEYHLRRHTGSKPYKCNMCDYSCVNKSMLNSHLKSHSNVYQYRCSDCSYATKYCHSLKLHLRKYNHQPAMVLNPDGTPNPLPIIDVYGTRRGPKIKRPDPLLEGLASTNPPVLPGQPIQKSTKKKGLTGPKKKTQPKPSLHQQMILDARDLSPKPARSPQYISSMPNQSATPPLHKIKEEPSSGGDSDTDMRIPINSHHHHHLNSSSNGKITQLPQAPISPSSIALILQRSNSNGEQGQQRKEAGYPHQSPGSPNPLEIYNAALNQYLLNPMFHMPNASLNDLLAAQMANEQKTKLLAQLLQSGMIPTSQQQNLANELRTVVTSANSNGFPSSGNGMVLDLSGTGTGITGAVVEDVKKRNRKGKARRYERRENSEDDEDDVMMMSMRHGHGHMQEDDEALDFSNNNNNASYKDKNKKRKLVEGQGGPTDLSQSHPSPPLFQNMMCKYCEISFPGRELYSIHMNYHSGDKNPFLCRSCGKKTRDKIEFFRHLATDPH